MYDPSLRTLLTVLLDSCSVHTMWIFFRGFVIDFPEEPRAASSLGGVIVDVDVVVFTRHRFLHKGFVHSFSVDLDVVLLFHQSPFFVKPITAIK